ncbi:unnamed protein product [Ceutorhynchus assimilis]|uniref:Protein sleepless n=1 Tax=Ceutorhynchus assimilis TaxID=467358 RepID=A0A9N9MHY9_9CUCU|nr:unnamed protein product [Ceutorhynchus assimilis]
MLLKILFCAVSLVAAIEATKCYFCNDSSKYGNCDGQNWPVYDCPRGCVSYEAKIGEKPKSVPQIYSARYRRGCLGIGGIGETCQNIKEELADRWWELPEFHCEECNEDYCNNRANHPGTKLTF